MTLCTLATAKRVATVLRRMGVSQSELFFCAVGCGYSFVLAGALLDGAFWLVEKAKTCRRPLRGPTVHIMRHDYLKNSYLTSFCVHVYFSFWKLYLPMPARKLTLVYRGKDHWQYSGYGAYPGRRTNSPPSGRSGASWTQNTASADAETFRPAL